MAQVLGRTQSAPPVEAGKIRPPGEAEVDRAVANADRGAEAEAEAEIVVAVATGGTTVAALRGNLPLEGAGEGPGVEVMGAIGIQGGHPRYRRKIPFLALGTVMITLVPTTRTTRRPSGRS